jgi:hypothetical protein
MDFAQYDEVPRELTGKIIERHKAEKQTVEAH